MHHIRPFHINDVFQDLRFQKNQHISWKKSPGFHLAQVDADAEMVDEDGVFGSKHPKWSELVVELLGGVSCFHCFHVGNANFLG